MARRPRPVLARMPAPPPHLTLPRKGRSGPPLREGAPVGSAQPQWEAILEAAAPILSSVAVSAMRTHPRAASP